MLNIQYFNANYPKVDKTARQALYEMGIKTSYDENRIIYYCSAQLPYGSNSNFYMQEANGLILDRNTNKVLMVPPHSLRYRIDTEVSNTYLAQGMYQIYRVLDGSTLHLYYYTNYTTNNNTNDNSQDNRNQGRWVISTTRGFDMNHIKYVKEKSFQDILCECLSHAGFGTADKNCWEEFTNQLDPKRCYTFLFRHPSFHKFRPEKKLVFVQSVDINVESPNYLTISTGPLVFMRDLIIAPQERYTEKVNNLRELYRVAVNSMANLSDDNITYGFILRSVNPEITKTHSNLYIEGKILRYIKKTWYDHKYYNTQGIKYPDDSIIVLNAVLTRDELFTKVFPQYKDAFNAKEAFIRDIIHCMAHDDSSDEKDDSVAQYANILKEVFDKKVNYSLQAAPYDSRVRVYTDFVMHPDNIKYLK